ncbi:MULTISPECIES: cell division protein FtsA [Virgibacillus]|uniref:Cell division protein FtsA n=2 Tax=Virgibacillus TaxID=84406 RepID=A0A024QCI2_9BACI|nr:MULTISPECIES: cell division protein FtsA [Virgibacillus]EQB36506.1 cell division protein FtsA [Virgibacillus sp. CM-4]MYL42340.1 cell division protein FtsA [Virgibacillus massiliensis]GGJ43369.1 cell division protein FtsA [Virgibacillus kapii]CDQ40204.1 Cell division protein FtsA [Virgibacillus massiliensis]
MNNNEILVSLDIGTSKIKVIIGEVLNDSLNIIGVGSAKSNGMKKGAIIDIDQTVQSIRNAVEQAERMVGMQIDRVVVGINGSHIQLQPCHGIVAVQSENREIDDEDINRVIDGAQVMSIPPEREIIDVIPKQFIVDGLDEINDPRGMIGVRLEMEGTIITCSKTILHNILKCVERANLQIADICLQPLAAGTIALSKDERNMGVALIDVGGGCSTVSVFENDQLVSTSVIQLGGDNITKDLSIGLRTSTEEAEDVKLNHGHAFYDYALEDEVFDVSIIGSNSKQTYNQLEIADMIEARMEEIYAYAEREIRKMGYQGLPGGYVLTGGTMAMPGVLELAEDLFHSNVRIAIPDYIGVREPQFTAGVGILQFAYRNAKIQGKELFPTVIRQDHQENQQPKRVKKQQKSNEPKENKKKESGIANLFKYFFD